MKSRRAASLGLAAVCSVGGGRTRSMGCRARDGIEQRKQQQSGEKAADMRLPGDAGTIRADGDRSDAKDDVDAEPYAEKTQHPSVAQRMGQRQRRHLCGSLRIAAAERQKT